LVYAEEIKDSYLGENTWDGCPEKLGIVNYERGYSGNLRA